MGLLLIFFFLSIVFSFLCSVWEAVLLSITPSFVNTQLRKGTSIGKTLTKFKEDIDRPLSAILTLNTIAHTVGAIGVGAQASVVFGNTPVNLGLFTISGESVVASVMTLAILVLSEIIPKTIGANMWKSLAPFTVKSLAILLKVLTPFVWLSQLITKSLKKDDKSILSRADFLALADVGMESGVLEEKESNIINNLLAMDQLKVHDIMTPRVVMQTINEETSLGAYYEKYQPMRFSRIPVFEGKSDHITGVALKDDILRGIIDGKRDEPLKTIKREIKFIHQDKTLNELFNYLTDNNLHLAVVVDNYGSVTGLVTQEDIFETLLGMEITDETDGVADLQALARKRWEERAKKLGLIE